MASQDSFGAKSTLDVGDQAYEIYRLSSVTGDGLDVESLPFSLKVLLENLLRTEDGADITADHIRALAGWDADADPDRSPSDPSTAYGEGRARRARPSIGPSHARCQIRAVHRRRAFRIAPGGCCSIHVAARSPGAVWGR